jgi:hypothetical protein
VILEPLGINLANFSKSLSTKSLTLSSPPMNQTLGYLVVRFLVISGKSRTTSYYARTTS